MKCCATVYPLGDTAQDVIASILKEEPAPLPVEVPDKLRWIVEKALRKKKEERYQTAREMFSDLRHLHKHENELRLINERAVSTDSGSSDQTRGDTIEKGAMLTRDITARTTPSAKYWFSEVKRHSGVAMTVLTAFVIAVVGIAFGLYKFVSKNQIQTTNRTNPS